MYIIGRTTIWPSTTTGRSWVLCMPKMALCGELTIGVDSREPNTPPFVMVNEPPVSSSMVIVPARAREAKLPMAFSISAKFMVSASRSTSSGSLPPLTKAFDPLARLSVPPSATE